MKAKTLIEFGIACVISASVGLAEDYYVATDGLDTNPGTLVAPFATLTRAQSAARNLRATADKQQSVTVYVRGGIYQLAEPLTLTNEDAGTAAAPVVYRAYADETPVLTGGVPITGFTQHTGAILKCDVTSQYPSGERFKQLYYDGQRQTLAQYPNIDPADPITSGWAFVDPKPVPKEVLTAVSAKRAFCFSSQDNRSWARPTDGEVFIYPTHEWWNNIVPIESVDSSRQLITLRKNCSYEITPGDRYFVRGLFEELDAPGEWYLDTGAHVLYFWPPRRVKDAAITVWAPKLKSLIQFEADAAFITVQGFTLECCSHTALLMKDARHCTVAGCTIRNTTGYAGAAIAIRSGNRNQIVGCDIHDVGSNGIQLSGGDQKTLTPGNNVAENNHITRTGLDYRQGVGIALQGVGNRVSRNTIHHLPRFAIQFGGNRNTIERNHLHHVCLDTMDTGAIYGMSLNWFSAHGTVIRHNFIHDVIGRSGKDGTWRSPYYAWGIYLDWSAMGCTVSGNIVARCSRSGIHLHDGRDNLIENNIIIECGTGLHENAHGNQIEGNGWNTESQYWKRGLSIFNWAKQYESVATEPAWQNVTSLRDPRTLALSDGRTMYNNIIRRNILAYRNTRSLAIRLRNVPVDHNQCDRNLIWHDGQPIRTDVFRVKDTTGPNLIANPSFETVTNGDAPAHWLCRLPSAESTAACVSAASHDGESALRLRAVASPANADKPEWERQIAVSSTFIKQVTPGQAYQFAVWLKADKQHTPVRIEPLSFRKNAYYVSFGQEQTVGVDWKRYDVAFQFPKQNDANYHDGMTDTFYVRVTLRSDAGTLWIDDAELRTATVLPQWQAWQDLGWDRHSIVADPQFVDPDHDDYRLKRTSPAWKLGFKPIPIDQIGCYQDPSRASWPIDKSSTK